MDGIGIGVLIVLIVGLASVVLYGLVTAVTAFRLRPDTPEREVARLQVVRGSHSPIDLPRRGRRIEVNRRQLLIGILCMVVAGLWLLGILNMSWD
jgi:hypothetical protein